MAFTEIIYKVRDLTDHSERLPTAIKLNQEVERIHSVYHIRNEKQITKEKTKWEKDAERIVDLYA